MSTRNGGRMSLLQMRDCDERRDHDLPGLRHGPPPGVLEETHPLRLVFVCAGARRPSLQRETSEPVLTNTELDLERAVPIPMSVPRVRQAQGPTFSSGASSMTAPMGVNKLAIASLACGLAGIPLFGLVAGLVAVLLGVLALSAIRATAQRGLGLALAGVILGSVDVTGWIILLGIVLTQHGLDLHFAELPSDAIGNPHNLGWSHTQGVISQMRTQRIESRQVHVIQTQAAVNPGNSGGGLFDQEGYLLGINAWTADKSISDAEPRQSIARSRVHAPAKDSARRAPPSPLLGQPAASGPPPGQEDRDFACPQCGAALRVTVHLLGKQVRCLRRRTVFRIPLQ